jgi:YD repeat-containing protein
MLRRLFGRGGRGRYSLEVTDVGVTRTLEDGRVESVTWDALAKVTVATTSQGPFAEDVFFVLETSDSGCLVPASDAPEGFVARLQELPGFDNEQLIEAMGSADDAQFVCWQRDS